MIFMVFRLCMCLTPPPTCVPPLRAPLLLGHTSSYFQAKMPSPPPSPRWKLTIYHGPKCQDAQPTSPSLLKCSKIHFPEQDIPPPKVAPPTRKAFWAGFIFPEGGASEPKGVVLHFWFNERAFVFGVGCFLSTECSDPIAPGVAHFAATGAWVQLQTHLASLLASPLRWSWGFLCRTISIFPQGVTAFLRRIPPLKSFTPATSWESQLQYQQPPSSPRKCKWNIWNFGTPRGESSFVSHCWGSDNGRHFSGFFVH